jgi:hypothetical protein
MGWDGDAMGFWVYKYLSRSARQIGVLSDIKQLLSHS